MAETKITKATLNKSFWRWFYGNLTCFTQEHMQTFGYMWSMLPIIQELYADKAEQQEKLHTYSPFFNTEPQIGSIVVGITAGLEEARANGAGDIDDEMINGIRAGLMGPLAGIGDSLIVGTYIPILLGIALGFSKGGSVAGILFYIIVWNATSIWFQRTIYMKGYAPKGKTPVVKVEAQKFKVNMLSAISKRGKLRFMLYKENMDSEKLIDFMGRLIRDAHKKVFLILDNLWVHHSKKVQEWLEKHKDRIEVFYLPSYAPEYNPDELVNSDLKRSVGQQTSARSKD